MMKNSEWGAVAYLSQSKYGKYGNDDYTGVNKEVYQNKSNSYMTGSSNGTPSQEETIKQYSYNDISSEVEGIGQCGPGASTTGNITGVYDMNGGASEYVMGYYTQAVSGTTYPWGSSGTGISAGFENKIDDKYFDTYIDSNYSEKTCNNGICYGHALSETKEWYNNGFRLIYGAAPWMTRGLITKTNDSKGEGMFNLDMYQGINLSTISFRIILAPIS